MTTQFENFVYGVGCIILLVIMGYLARKLGII